MTKHLQIGVSVCDKMQLHLLQKLVEECGHSLTARMVQADLKSAEKSPASVEGKVDAWIVLTRDDTSEVGDELDALNTWLDELTVPAIICESISHPLGSEEYVAWSQRLKKKLNHLEGTINLEREEERPAHQIWVLGASTGGPAVVKEFLSYLPPNLDVGFVYVQHINRGFDVTLAQTISKHSHYRAYLAKNGDIVRANQVAVVSPEHATEILDNGTLEVREHDWQAPYSPSVDCVVASVAYAYPNRCGVIVFTGMGDDGAASARIMHQKGGQVWVQTPGSCTSDSMPQSVLKQGCVDFKGTPYALAQRLVQTVQQSKYVTSRKSTATPVKKAAP